MKSILELMTVIEHNRSIEFETRVAACMCAHHVAKSIDVSHLSVIVQTLRPRITYQGGAA